MLTLSIGLCQQWTCISMSSTKQLLLPTASFLIKNKTSFHMFFTRNKSLKPANCSARKGPFRTLAGWEKSWSRISKQTRAITWLGNILIAANATNFFEWSGEDGKGTLWNKQQTCSYPHLSVVAAVARDDVELLEAEWEVTPQQSFLAVSHLKEDCPYFCKLRYSQDTLNYKPICVYIQFSLLTCAGYEGKLVIVIKC